jgi:hypothetical protein
MAIIIVGIAITVSIQLFRSNAIEAKRDILIEETTTLGLMALQYFKKPAELGGGSHSFIGWTIPSSMNQTANGNFMTSSATADELVITGTGTEVVTGTDSIEVQTTVTTNSVVSIIIH